MEAYASVYEGYGKKKKGDCVSKSEKGDHNCAKKVCHEEYGEGETIFGQHAVPDENGFVSHYNVQFEHGIVEDVSVEELDVLTMEAHNEHVEHQEDTISEMGGIMKAIGKVAKKVIGPVDQSPEAEAARVGKRRPTQGKQGPTVGKQGPMGEDADLYDLIKGHLIDEGFADTEEAALAIMANMSEEWRNEVVEQSSARSREFEKRLPAERGSRGREFEHGSTRSANTPSGNLADKSPRDPKTGKLMY